MRAYRYAAQARLGIAVCCVCCFILQLNEILHIANPLFTHCRTLRRNRTNKMAPLLHFVNGRSHIDVKVQHMTMSYEQS